MGPMARLAIASAMVVVVDQATKALAHAGLLGTGWAEPLVNPDLALGLASGPGSAQLLLGGSVQGLRDLVDPSKGWAAFVETTDSG